MKLATGVVLGLAGATGVFFLIRHFIKKPTTAPTKHLDATPQGMTKGSSLQPKAGAPVSEGMAQVTSLHFDSETLNFDSETMNFDAQNSKLKGFLNANGKFGFIKKGGASYGAKEKPQEPTKYRCEWTNPRTGLVESVYLDRPCTKAQANSGWVTKAN